MHNQKDKNWVGITNRQDLLKVFSEYVSLRIPMRANRENWPINNETNLSMIVLGSINSKYDKPVDHSLLTDDDLKIGIRICMEIDIAGLPRLRFYSNISKAINYVNAP